MDVPATQRSAHREEMCRAKVRGRQVGREVVNTGVCMGVSVMAGESASSHAAMPLGMFGIQHSAVPGIQLS